MKRQRVWSVLAAGALALGACGGSDTTDAASGDEVEVEYISPIGDFLGFDQGADFDQDAAQAEFAEQERAAQESIAACMTAEGFEYIPVDFSSQQMFFEEELDGLEWGSDEWTAKYGFGVSTQRFSQSKVGPDLVGNSYNDMASSDEMPVDPNQDYINSLSDNERTAYEAALWGGEDNYPEPAWASEDREPTDEEMEAFEQEMMDFEPTGCQNEAYNNMSFGGADQEQFQAFDEAFSDAFEELDERMMSHPDVAAYQTEVQVCVEEQGLEYLSQDDAYEYFEAELDAAGLGWEADGDPLANVDTSDFTDEDYEQAYREYETQPLAPEKLEALAEVQANEIKTAVAVGDCGGGWQNEQAALQSVRIELEEEFLAANADELAEFQGLFGN